MHMPVEINRDLTNEEKHRELRSYLNHVYHDLISILDGFTMDFRHGMMELRDKTFKKITDDDLLWDVTEESK